MMSRHAFGRRLRQGAPSRAQGSAPAGPPTGLRLRPAKVDTSSKDEQGRLVWADDRLVAVLVRLDGPEHGDARGQWLLEAGFGLCTRALPPGPFRDLQEAKAWIEDRLRTVGRV